MEKELLLEKIAFIGHATISIVMALVNTIVILNDTSVSSELTGTRLMLTWTLIPIVATIIGWGFTTLSSLELELKKSNMIMTIALPIVVNMLTNAIVIAAVYTK